MKPRVESVMDALCDIGRPIMLRYLRPDSCIASSKIGLNVLSRFGIRSHPLPVKFAAFNERGHEFLSEDHPEWVRSEKDGAYGIGAGYGPGPDPDKWDGHLILLVRGTYALDLSIDQASRPTHGIVLSPLYFRWGRIGGGRVKERVVLKNPRGGSLTYELDLDNTAWKVSPNWKRDWSDVAGQITAAVKRELHGHP